MTTTPPDDSNSLAHGLRDNYDHARDVAAKVLHDARDKASETYASSKASAFEVTHRAIDGLETNPLAILAGGLVVGVLAGALIPRSAKEKELLAPIGQRLSTTARQAIAAAKEAGQQQLEEAGLTRGAAKDRGRELLDGAVKALSSAGAAAAQSTKRAETA